MSSRAQTKTLCPPTAYEPIEVTTLTDGQPLIVPLHRLRGGSAGPTVGLVGVLHGDEPLSIEIIRRVLSTVGEGDLKGEIVALPTTNGPALEALTRNSPIDMLDLNRNFPGDPHGWLTEQLADAISDKFLPHLDLVIDLHCGGLFATVDYVYATRDAAELALALGWELTYITDEPHPGGLLGVARARGVPGAILEVGGGQQDDEFFIGRAVQAVLNALIHYGLVDGRAEPAERQLTFTKMETLRPRNGGILHPEIGLERLRGPVEAGEVLGRIISPLTFETLEELTAPFDGYLLLLRAAVTPISPGDFAYMIADASSTEVGDA